jgi:hypothetical protein
MPRGPRLGALGTLHPVLVRDLARQVILRDDADRDRFVARVVRREPSARYVGRPGLWRDTGFVAPPLSSRVPGVWNCGPRGLGGGTSPTCPTWQRPPLLPMTVGLRRYCKEQRNAKDHSR